MSSKVQHHNSCQWQPVSRHKIQAYDKKYSIGYQYTWTRLNSIWASYLLQLEYYSFYKLYAVVQATDQNWNVQHGSVSKIFVAM